MEMKKRILVAPLNWGLGHATRCMPIITSLIENGYTPILASDGMALDLLRKEFPNLDSIELPSYNITYAKKGKHFKLKLIWDSPKWLKAIKQEHAFITKLVKTELIDGIISDNRLGVHSNKIPSVFISHQLNVLSGNTSWFSSFMHQSIIKKFDECWVPDVQSNPNLSGKLGHVKHKNLNLKYIGPLSRFKKVKCKPIYDLLVLLSGPEPQRTILEEKLFEKIKEFEGKVLFVKGVIEEQQVKLEKDNLTIYNFMNSESLEKAINQSKYVISRAGYTTIMDLAKLEKKAFFIPTSGQYEQEYLATRLQNLGLAPSCNQDEFEIHNLNEIDFYKGLQSIKQDVDFSRFFRLFEGKREFTANT